MNNKNYISSYLNFYKKQEEPGYAILLTGEWGAGKTYTVKQHLSDDEMYYVSLFGFTSTSEIYASVFLQMSPKKAMAKQLLNNIGDASISTDILSLGISKALSGITNAIIKENIKNDKIIVFDDIERCNVGINDILGVINKYVEHHKCRVIAIAHDEKIEGAFKEAKEKIFGQTLKVTPNIDETFESFFEKHVEVEIQKISRLKNIILILFKASGCKSLRVLKHIINDCIRLLACLEEKHLANNDFINALLHTFLPLTIEYRMGKLSTSDLENRTKIMSDYSLASIDNNDAPKPLLEKLERHYFEQGISISLLNSDISDENLIDMIINGFYDKNSIIKDINRSHYFLPKKEIKSWLRLINFDEQEDDAVSAAYVDTKSKLDNYEITDAGDILHIYNLFFLMASVNEISKTYQEILDEAKKYIDELVDLGLYQKAIESDFNYTYDEISAYGHGFWITDEYRDYSKELYMYVREGKNRALEMKYPEYANEALTTLSSDPNEFRRIVSKSYGELGKFSGLPILELIPASTFVDRWLKCPRASWGLIQMALDIRYSGNQLLRHLKNEKQWLIDVAEELKKIASQEDGLRKLRIERLIPKIYMQLRE